ncbi:MAG: sigma-70 family RNA polymerase sigma factor [Chitinophagaceae bacterium]
MILWQAVKQGDRIAFDRLYHLYVSPLFAAVYKHLRRREDAEDIIQEAFLDCWEKRAEITIESSVFNYLYSMARYKTLRFLKLNSHQAGQLQGLTELLQQHASFAEYTVSEQRLRQLEAALDHEMEALPHQMKKVLSLRVNDGMSAADIAGNLLISPHTVKNHLAKVRKRLRQVMLPND